MSALYSKIHPEYASYIYLLAPISLAILNPIGFVLMEISKIKEKNAENNVSHIGLGCAVCFQNDRVECQ